MTGRGLARGFTLIELLVVMSIIAVLLTIAVPRYFHTLERSRETVLHQDLSVLLLGYLYSLCRFNLLAVAAFAGGIILTAGLGAVLGMVVAT